MWSDNKHYYVLDGGFSTELERNGFSFLSDPLWSARILHTDPEAAVKVHKSYLNSGADIITTVSYQASIPGFMKYLDISVEESKELLKLSVKLAQKAKEEYSKDSPDGHRNILIAGSIGPYGAALSDGSEYTGHYCNTTTHEELIEWHRPRIQCLVDAGVDILAFETIPAIKEGEALMKLLREFPNTQAWLSFSSQSLHKTSSDEDMSLAAENCLKLAPPSQLVAIGVNCCPPEYAISLLKDIGEAIGDFPLIVYPNSGEAWDNKTGWTGNKTLLKRTYWEALTKTSAKIIGGCCRTTADDVYQISKFLKTKENA